MCIVFLAIEQHPDFPIILAANRDEFHRRNSLGLHIWPQHQGVIGGRDRQAGGSWLLASPDGKFATVTNIREGVPESAPLSRGEIPLQFVTADEPVAYLEQLAARRSQYAGFNLLAGDSEQVWYFNSKTGLRESLKPGLYGLSNGRLDTDWPKVREGKQGFARLVTTIGGPDIPALFKLLSNTTQADSAELPDTGVPQQWEQLLSSIFIRHPQYGTRCSTLLLRDNAGSATLIERNFSAQGHQLDQRTIQFR